MSENKTLMLGNEALARGAYESGVKVISSYPGTPSTEFTEFASEYKEIYTEWAPNEKVALEVAIGASFAGARAMAAMKHVGLNVAADPLFTAAYTGVNAGLVLVVADDPGMHSSQNEQDTRMYGKAAHVPVLEPSDSAEALAYVAECFKISEKYDTPVILRTTTRVAHARSLVEIGQRLDIENKEYKKDMAKYVMMPGPARARHIVVEAREKQLAQDADIMDINRIELRDMSIGIICSGLVYQYVREALPEASVLKLGMVYPLPEGLIKQFSASVENLIIIEELEPFIETQVKAWGIPCKGKELFSVQGELNTSIIRERILGVKNETASVEPVPVRPPVLCPGCPHRGTFTVLSKLKYRVLGDIGCYTLGALPPLSAMDACVCMGASIGMAHGFDKAMGSAEKTVAVIGDSTFIHSGITSLINIVYNKGASTVLILDNSITGMTGHQQNPATGKTICNEPTHQLDLEALVRAIGVKNVRIADPFDMLALEAVLEEETARPEPSVIIVRRACALLDKTPRKHYMVLPDNCRACRACMRVGCPAIEITEKGVKINSSLCYGCGKCSSLCKFGAIIKEAH